MGFDRWGGVSHLGAVGLRVSAALVMTVTALGTAIAQVVNTDLWGASGDVLAIARSGNTLYIGGYFSTVGPCTGGGVPTDRATGAPRRAFARVAGTVRAVTPDGRGGWYIGGSFTAVGGQPRSNLAHVLADGSVAAWNPDVRGVAKFVYDPNGNTRPAGVEALALRGRTLYVGGRFYSVGGRARSHLAAVDVKTGAILVWAPDANDEVRCLALGEGVLYAGGDFTSIGDSARAALAAVDLRDGRATDWDPHPATRWGDEEPSRVRAVVARGRVVYAGGDFDRIGGAARNSIAALDACTGRATAWDAALGPAREYRGERNFIWPTVSAIALEGHAVYLGGWFESAGGNSRFALAAVDERTGQCQSFDARIAGGSVGALAVHGRALYAAGYFVDIGGATRPNLAALDLHTGDATRWNPRANGGATALGVEGDEVFVGGGFTSLYDWQIRGGLAALDLSTGALLPWDAHVDGWVTSLALMDGRLYMAGGIRSVSGLARPNIAAVDAATGAVLPWVPDIAQPVGPESPTVTAQDGVVYAAGYNLLDLPRHPLAGYDGVTGATTSWAPLVDGFVHAILPDAPTIYVAGHFSRVGGVTRDNLAALAVGTAAAEPWAPSVGSGLWDQLSVVALARRDHALYLGGTLGSVNGVPRGDVGALDTVTGDVLPWDPEVGGDYGYSTGIHVASLAVMGDRVWIGGNFQTMHGVPSPYLASVDAVSGIPTGEVPPPNGRVYSLLASGDTLFVGGSFLALGTTPRACLAAMVLPGAALQAVRRPRRGDAAPETATLSEVAPNPVRTTATIRFSLPEAGSASLAVYDLQGRRIVSLLDRVLLPAGPRALTVHAGVWEPGVYFCRLEVGPKVLMRRLVVTR